jgi:hypothetical protein
MDRVRRTPSRLWEVAPSAQPPARFRFPLRAAAAGILLGVLLGTGGTLGLRALTAPEPPAPPAASGTAGSPLEAARALSAPAAAPAERAAESEIRDFGDFLRASEIVNQGITALPWGEPVGSALLLNRIVEGLEIEKQVEKAEKARAALKKAKPEVAALTDEVIGGQKDVLLCLADASGISPHDIQAKAQINLGKIDKARQVLRLERVRRGKASAGLRIRVAGDQPRDVAALLDGLVKELEGDAEGASAVYVNFRDRFPESRLKFFALAREMETMRRDSPEACVAHLFQELPGIVVSGELPPAVENSIRVVITELRGLDPEITVEIQRAMDQFRKPAFRHPIREFRSVRLNEVELPADVQQKNRGWVFSLYHSLNAKKEWTQVCRTDDKTKTAEFARAEGGALDPATRVCLSPLTLGLTPKLDPEAVTTVRFEGK